jgi:hypothetical protein
MRRRVLRSLCFVDRPGRAGDLTPYSSLWIEECGPLVLREAQSVDEQACGTRRAPSSEKQKSVRAKGENGHAVSSLLRDQFCVSFFSFAARGKERPHLDSRPWTPTANSHTHIMSTARLREALTAGGPTSGKGARAAAADGVLSPTPDTPDAAEWRARASIIDTACASSSYLDEEGGACDRDGRCGRGCARAGG